MAGREKGQKTPYQTFRDAVSDILSDISENIRYSPGEPKMILGHSFNYSRTDDRK